MLSAQGPNLWAPTERIYLLSVRSQVTQLLDLQDGQICGHSEDRATTAASHCKRLLPLQWSRSYGEGAIYLCPWLSVISTVSQAPKQLLQDRHQPEPVLKKSQHCLDQPQ